MSDEIIREVWRIKDSIGKEVNYSIPSLGALLQRRQDIGNKKFVDLSLLRKKKAIRTVSPSSVHTVNRN